jgi:hypothetical protein
MRIAMPILWALVWAVFGFFDGRPASADDRFPAELVDFVPYADNPVFTASGKGNWDTKIRERGWILRDGDLYRLWFTGYDGTREGMKLLGLATSRDGLHWERHPQNPIHRDHWVEDMMVVKHGGLFYMFAEGRNDEAQLLVSPNGLDWTHRGKLDIRRINGEPIQPGPFGTPTVWIEGDWWYLFYERRDKGVWLARSNDRKVWRHVVDEPVLVPGPTAHEEQLIALNQVIKHAGRYYAYYHGRGREPVWSTNVAVSLDLVRWQKYSRNPILPARANKSSGIVVAQGGSYRLYTMHDEVHVHFPRIQNHR